ncbi:helix-turn-helix transcriptional regulator [Silvimonas iriomotensis]|uniref:Transcriptional regulator, AlpA family n=1 Tax=Silvimonas iriomotensis TaxID=449662 RepID=A0ABQ2P4I3_9NEIS|nr:AlpA family phage regulatory protein [Silvimonas iriomotensis]GGP18152.1 hypothetical protein GCM10010970_03440 [Silvimonas iriomotensis]
MSYTVIPLPETGFVRLPVLIGDTRTGRPGLLPFSEATLWRMVRAGSFPCPVKLSERITAWKVEDIRQWLKEFNQTK